MKIGRNDPCPCGSGKKYKKCCSPKFDQPLQQSGNAELNASKSSFLDISGMSKNFIDNLMPIKLEGLSEEVIVEKLWNFGIEVEKEEFINDLKELLDPFLVIELWKERYACQLSEMDEAYLVNAVLQLSKQWASGIFSTDKLGDLVEVLQRLPEDEYTQSLEIYRTIWRELKQNYIVPNGFLSMDNLQTAYDWEYDIEAIVLDYEVELSNAMIAANHEERLVLHQERVDVCLELIAIFPENNLDSHLDLRKSIGASYKYIGDLVKAEEIFAAITDEHPECVWDKAIPEE